MSELRLDGKVALVTGSASGIGLGIVMKLAERGAKVVVNGNYRESGQGPEIEVAEKIRALGGEAVSVNGSVFDPVAVKSIVAKAIDTYGRLDIVVNNAGNAGGPLVQEGVDERFDQQINVHVRGSTMIVAEAWPHLVKSGQASILNVSSATSWGFKSQPGWITAYPTAKAAIYGLTRQMAGAGADHGIKVNMLLPRAVTPLLVKHIGGTPLGDFHVNHLKSDQLAASVVYMVHPDFPASGQFFSSAGGRVSRVIFAMPDGYFNPNLTPEDFRDNFDKVWGDQDKEGYVNHFFELTDQEREMKYMRPLIEGQK